MKYGRVLKPESLTEYDLILAKDFGNSVSYKGEVICADPGCSAPMYHKFGTYVMGASYKRSAHFASYNLDDHVEGCLAIMRDQSSKASIGLLDAILNPFAAIVMNINFNTGHLDFGKRGKSAIEHEATSYNMFLDKHKHASVAVLSLSELFKLKSRIEEQDNLAAARIHLGHCQDIIALDNAVVKNGKGVGDLYTDLYLKGANAFYAGQMPMIFEFDPLPKYKQKAGAFLYGNGVNVRGSLNEDVTIQHVLDFNGQMYLKDRFLDKGRGKIMAVPYVDHSQAVSNRNYLKTHDNINRSPTYHLFWRVVDEKQFHSDSLDVLPGIQTELFDQGYGLNMQL